MTDYTWPEDIVPYAQSFYLQPHTGGTESPFSRVTKVYGLSAPRWVCKIALRAPDSADTWGGPFATWGEQIDAFLAQLKGRQNRVWLFDFRRPGGAPTFGNSAASPGDTAMTLTGASLGDIRVGEYFGGDGRPHIITGLSVSGSDLIATFEPPLVSTIFADGATFEKVSGIFRLTSDDAGDNMNEVGSLIGYNLEFVEDTAGFGLPIELPAVFNNVLGAQPYWGAGDRVVFPEIPYDAIDFEKTEATNQYYVSWGSGNNANAGTSSGAAWKTLDYAVAHAVSPAVINLLDDFVGLGSWAASIPAYSGKLKLKGKPTRTIIHSRFEAENAATFSWSASSGAYASTTYGSSGASNSPAMFDGNFRDAYGFPTPIIAASSVANCQATPGSYYYSATGPTLYVHMQDGRIPDPTDGWIYSLNFGASRFEIQQALSTNAGVILYENLEFVYNAGTSDSSAVIIYRPQTTGAVNSARFGMKNCLAYGGSGGGIGIYDADIIALENCGGAYNHSDNIWYQSFLSSGINWGEFITIYETNCFGHHAGYNSFSGQAALGTSCNCSTAHQSMHILRANCVYDHANGAVVADVNGCLSVGLNVDSQYPTGTAAPKACFWHDNYLGAGAHMGMYLWGCFASDNGDSPATHLLDNTAQAGGSGNNGQIYIENWRGQTTGTVVGSLKDWAGNPTTL